MINCLLCNLVKLLLWLRYRIRVRGEQDVARRGTRGILFLPNHPALIDPVMLVAYLHGRFAPRPLADQDQINRFFVRWLARRIGVRPVPDIRTHGPAARAQVEAVVQDCIAGLRRGENLLLYPAGHIYRTRYEDLRGNSAVERILREAPEARIVLVRTRGLWGSRFSMAGGQFPNVARIIKHGTLQLLASGLFLAPRRRVLVELHEPCDLPRQGDRNELNAVLERFYNADAPANTYVPSTRWEAGGVRVRPEPEWSGVSGALTSIPETTRKLVIGYLREKTGAERIRDEDRLAQDLGLDSLAKAELVLWLGQEFGYAEGDVDALQTAGDVLLAALGQAIVTRPVELKPVPPKWTRGWTRRRATIPSGDTILDVFLAQARRGPGRAIVADQLTGVRSYRDLITAVLVLRPLIEKSPGARVGIMLPASVAATTVYLATLFARKEPVMVNWTAGAGHLKQALDLADVQRILTVRPLVARLETQGTHLAGVKDRLVFLDDLRSQVGWWTKLWAALRAHGSWSALSRRAPPATAVVLLTSGSETVPKAVPLTHANLLANLRDIAGIITIYETDAMLGFLPPFHSFGLAITMLLPLLAGLRAAYHPNPTEAWVLARLIQTYGATLVCGTPTFLGGIVRATRGPELASLRLAVTGAERCPERTYAALAERCPGAVILEGYGITECSPVVAVSREDDPRPGTIGRVLPSLEYAVVDVDTWQRVAPGGVGLLLVRGPSVFEGYLGDDVASPFVEFDGRSWYRTGDLVSADADGVLTFRGRLKRFVKLGGEMISLPAVEAALERHYAGEADEGPVIAIDATPNEDHPELVLFTTRPAERATVNQQIRAAGLSPLHNVTRVVQVEQIPVLGTGKTDYRTLREMLRRQP